MFIGVRGAFASPGAAAEIRATTTGFRNAGQKMSISFGSDSPKLASWTRNRWPKNTPQPVLSGADRWVNQSLAGLAAVWFIFRWALLEQVSVRTPDFTSSFGRFLNGDAKTQTMYSGMIVVLGCE